MTVSVFISHVATESDIAVWIKNEIKGLLGEAVKFFVSSDGEHIVGGDRWLDEILNALKKSNIVLVLCSEESVHRPWVNFEAGGAWMADKRVIPLCHGDMKPGKLPQPLATLQAYSLRKPQNIQQLVSLLATSAGVKPPQFDADALVQTLPLRTGTKPLGSPHQTIDRPDYEFDKRTGIWRHKVTHEAICSNCFNEGRISPLVEEPAGWTCQLKKCGKFYSNPDFDPPPMEPYDPRDYV